MRKSIFIVFLVIAGTCVTAWAQDHGHDQDHDQDPEQSVAHTLTCLRCISNRPTLTRNWFGLGEQLQEQGISVGLSLTQIYQVSLRGSGPAAAGPGVQTHNHAGRWTGTYDFEVELDLERLLNIPGATIYTDTSGSWSDGIDTSSIGSVFGVNNNAGGDHTIALIEAYWEQALLDDTLRLRIGKLDLTGGFECQGCSVAFDGNAFANDDSAQFLNAALNNNPTIPFPDNGLGVIAYYEPVPGFYVSAGVADAQASASETGFNTTFHDEDYFFTIVETGFVPKLPSANGDMRGAYRVGVWHDPQDKLNLNNDKTERDDMGFYLSFDQVIYNENTDKEDVQGAGLFARYGFAHSDINEINSFFSIGGQYQGLIPSRDNDVLGLGLATGRLVQNADFTRNSETVVETYYNAELTPGITLSPSLQWVINPGGVSGVGDAWVLGFRLQVTF